MIDGAIVKFGEKEFIAPPWTLKTCKKYARIIENPGGMDTMSISDQVDTLVDLIHSSLVRNYPDLDRDTLEELLDLHNAPAAIEAISRVSGYSVLNPGEAAGGSR